MLRPKLRCANVLQRNAQEVWFEQLKTLEMKMEDFIQAYHQRFILKAFQKGKNGENSYLETFETILSLYHVATRVWGECDYVRILWDTTSNT